MKLVLSGTVENISTRNDGTLKFTIGSHEVDSSQAGSLFQLRNKYIKCLLSDTNISPIEQSLIDEEVIKDGRKIKSKAQRLRAVLFKLHEQTQTSQTFDEFYNERMEGLIEHFKSKLND